MAVDDGDNTMYAPAIRSEANTKASSGSRIVTLHLDLDDLADPDIANHLHHDRHRQQLLAELFVEEQLHMSGIDDLERHAERRRQRHQHPAREPAMGRVDADLAQK